MIRLIEVCELNKASKNLAQTYALREVYINPKHVVSLREDDNIKRKLNEGMFLPELDESHCFTRIVLDKGHNGVELIVVGAPHTIQEKMEGGKGELLLG